ncbi:hypothetical protein DSL72_000011 [Monilinia vaccinii-corymbosi]|uniref:Carboxymuconolactone decarboxylase-like domain-containing protein n=1 Tax=Monilinia vaccinii-corymbosi TaxID=61207 RepID=A0A8A3PA46_9HELO|nr:hypothetical protein DSL72_000011 [Monilinia vaccinii-corymbosi]
MATPTASLTQLFDSCRESFPASVKEDSWYLVVASAIISLSNPAQIGDLYVYLTNRLEPTSQEKRRLLDRRFRDLIMKQWITVGVPRATVALHGLSQAEKEGDVDLKPTKKYTALDAGNHKRGSDFLDVIYGSERTAVMFTQWGADMEWLMKDVIYGLFYADDGVLDNLETELLTYTAIVCQGLPVTIVNHLMGLKRMGVNAAEAEGITKCAQAVAEWAGQDTSAWRPLSSSIEKHYKAINDRHTRSGDRLKGLKMAFPVNQLSATLDR